MGGSENLLLNNGTHLYFFVHISYGRKLAFWNTKRTWFLDFLYFGPFWGLSWPNFDPKSENMLFLADNDPKDGTKTKISEIKNKFSLYSKIPVSCQKYGQNRDEFYCLEANFHSSPPRISHTFCEILRNTSRLHQFISWQLGKLFQFCKKFLNPHNPNFQSRSKLRKIIFNLGPPPTLPP